MYRSGVEGSRAAGLRRGLRERRKKRVCVRVESGWDEWKGRTGTRLAWVCLHVPGERRVKLHGGGLFSDGYLSSKYLVVGSGTCALKGTLAKN